MLFIKISKTVTKHLGLYACGTILLGMGVGEVWKPSFLRYLIPFAVFLVLYPSMFDLEIERIKDTLTHPLYLIIALFLNLIVSPLLAFALSRVFFSESSPWLTVALVMFGCIPCGGMVPAFTGMLGGNINLSVAITALSLLLSILVVPLWSKILLGTLVPIPPWIITQYLFIIIVAPFLLAQCTRKILVKTKGLHAFNSFKKEIKALSGPGLMLFIFIIFVLNGESVQKDPTFILKVLIPVALFLVTLLVLGGLLARLTHASPENTSALQISTTVKNTAIAIALVIASFDAEVAVALAISGPLAQLPTILLFLRWKKSRHSPTGNNA